MATLRTPTRRTFGPTSLSEKHSLHVPYIDSPLPSPGLPSILPRHGKVRSSRWPRRIRRLVCWLACVAVIIWFARSVGHVKDLPYAVSYLSNEGGDASGTVKSEPMLGSSGIVILTDKRGKPRWTISMPRQQAYPLPPSEYANICSQSMELAAHLGTGEINKNAALHQSNQEYYYRDQKFIDIVDAEKLNLLPASHNTPGSGVVSGHVYMQGQRTMPLCEKTLTFVLQTEDAGFGMTLMGLWMSYGLAKKEGRAFFIDDTNWAYGRYTTYFKPPPMPSCVPPPPSMRIPCPHHTRHLLISASTMRWAFGKSFNEQFEDPHKTGVERQRPIFSLLRSGYEALFHLTGDDFVYYEQRIKDLELSTRARSGILVGIHARRGDLHPLEFQYQESYIPLEIYRETADDIISSHHKMGSAGLSHSEPSAEIVASDDPEVYTAVEMLGVKRAQFRISLASKTALDAATAAQGGSSRAMDGNVGWEGGFFKDLFWSLGATLPRNARDSPPPSQRASSLDAHSPEANNRDGFRSHPTPEALQLRELVGRAYILDLAVLGQSDAVVCGVSSVSCRLLAVMMGWDQAIKHNKWRNVDGAWQWKAIY